MSKSEARRLAIQAPDDNSVQVRRWRMFMATGMNDLAAHIACWRDSKGFVTPSHINDEGSRTRMNEKLMLVVAELAEACEAVRRLDWDLFKEEIADTMIRLFDLVGSANIDIEGEIAEKMAVNEMRPAKHGKEC